ncbi:MAG: DEAD/DEAH box helicase [Bryobacterales bacterium]
MLNATALLADPQATALYLFYQGAQRRSTRSLPRPRRGDGLGDSRSFTTTVTRPETPAAPSAAAPMSCSANPDMLHAGVLPHHTKWARFFEKLRYIVIDELHTYRDVFGSHLANVLRRLQPASPEFYGSKPQFICCSATIANPQELAERLTEKPVEPVEKNGAPAGEKYFVFYNPPVVNRQLGIRRSYINEARRMAQVFWTEAVGRWSLRTTGLRRDPRPLSEGPLRAREWAGRAIRGYRGGYLPQRRREIERQLRDGGTLRGGRDQRALELGVDIGSLDACVMAGYPGSIASTWQRAGRAGHGGDRCRSPCSSPHPRSTNTSSSARTPSSPHRPSAPPSTRTTSRSW